MADSTTPTDLEHAWQLGATDVQEACTKPLVLVVAVALVDQQQRVLLAQRPAGGHLAQS